LQLQAQEEGKEQMKVFFLSIFLSIALVSLAQVGGSSAQPGSNKSCVSDEFETYRDQVLPLWSAPKVQEAEWQACVRVLDPVRREIVICLTKYFDKRSIANYAFAAPTPLWEQYCQQRVERPKASIHEVASAAHLTAGKLDQPAPSLAKLAARLASIKINVVPRVGLVMDNPIYQFELRSVHGDHILMQTTSSLPNDKLVLWVEELKHLIPDATRVSDAK
jgi:hypothetical protein